MPKMFLIPEQTIAGRIYFLRGRQVMLDSDLAELYGVETFRLNEQVKRNLYRFPEDFMFQLTEEEVKNLTSQFAISRSWGGRRTRPYAFTEHGILMLSSVLNSERAIQANIHIIRVFVKLNKLMLAEKDLTKMLERSVTRLDKHEQDISLLFDQVKRLMGRKHLARKRIGFRGGDDV